MRNIVCEMLNIKYPILQGPMAWASDGRLAAAVSEEGGLGIMGIGFAPADVFRNEIRTAGRLTDHPYGCNLITSVPNSRELLEIILQEKVPVVELEGAPEEFSLLREYADALEKNGIVVIGKASSVREAQILERAGVQMVSVKGADGGGHIYGFTGTFTLIPQVVDAVRIPVINSSGVADARGVRASFMLGASAVEIGSRFLLAHECPVHENYKKAVILAEEGATVLTGTSVHDAVRGLENTLAKKVLKIEKDCEGKEAAEKIQRLCAGSLRKAAVEGDTDREGSVLVGQNVGMLTCEESVREIMKSLICGLEQILDS